MEEYLSNHYNPLSTSNRLDEEMITALLSIVCLEVLFILCILNDVCYNKNKKEKESV